MRYARPQTRILVALTLFAWTAQPTRAQGSDLVPAERMAARISEIEIQYVRLPMTEITAED